MAGSRSRPLQDRRPALAAAYVELRMSSRGSDRQHVDEKPDQSPWGLGATGSPCRNGGGMAGITGALVRSSKTRGRLVVLLVSSTIVGACAGHQRDDHPHRDATPGVRGGTAPRAVASADSVGGGTVSDPVLVEATAGGSASARKGTIRWRPTHPALSGEIEGYTSEISGPAGRPVHLKVSTVSATYRVAAYRVGAYRGGVARHVWTSPKLPGVRQRGPMFARPRTRTVTAPWRTTLTVGTRGWVDGFYLFKLSSSDHRQALVPYVVRSRVVVGKVALVAPVATWQAYNDWGGYSLYVGPAGDRRAWAVSFDRPYPAPGAGEMRFGVLPVVVAAERGHVPLAYLTDVDLDANPGVLTGARAYVSMGHDEYWSRRMRTAVEHARDQGTNLVFLGANTMYWKVRLAASYHGPRRTLVGYRTNAALDPARRRDRDDATGLYRADPRTGPENEVTGMRYECFPVDAPYRVVSPHWWGYRGTRVRYGSEFPHLVGVEADRVYPTPVTPRPLQILSHVGYSCGGVSTSAQSSYYTTTSGAAVLNLGTLRWTCALVGRCHPYELPARTVRFVRQVTRTVLQTFAEGPAGRQYHARDNVDQFDLPSTNTVPAS